jgi:hypothetical protein
MSNTKRYIMDLEEKFEDAIIKIVKDADCIEEAVKKAEELSSKEYNWIEADVVGEMVDFAWSEVQSEGFRPYV